MADPTMVNLPPLTFRASPNQSERNEGTKVGMVVIHEPVGSYAGALATCLNPSKDVSYHILCDEKCMHATQLVRYSKKAWSCASFNSVSDNISLAGVPSTWALGTLNRLARITAFRLWKRGLPAVYLKSPTLQSRGFTYHRNLGAAGGGHSDPRFNAVQHAFFVTAVKWHRAKGGFRDVWGRA